MQTKRLFRSSSQKNLLGVCAGIAEYLNLEIIIVRILFLIGFFIWNELVILYFILGLVIPTNPAHKIDRMQEIHQE